MLIWATRYITSSYQKQNETKNNFEEIRSVLEDSKLVNGSVGKGAFVAQA